MMPAPRLGGRWIVLLAALLSVSMGACSFDVDDDAQGVDDAPDGLLDTPTTEAIPEAPDDEGFDLELMFVDGNNDRVRVVRSHPTEPTVQDVLDGLAGLPTTKELEAHPLDPISTLLFASMTPIAQGTDGGQLRVLVQGEEIRQATNENPERIRGIYGQIVCSIAALDVNRVETVLLFDEVGPIPPVAENAEVLGGGAGPNDFRECVTAEDIAAAAADAEGGDGNEEGEEDGESTSTTEG